MKYKLLFLLLLTTISLKSQNIQQELLYVNQAIQREQNNFNHYQYRAYLHLKLKRYSKALTDIDDAIKYCNTKDLKKVSELYNLKGGIYKSSYEDDKAIAHFLMSFEFDNNNTGALNNLGSVYIRRKDYENAEKYLKKALEIHPNNNFANGNIARLYAKKGEYEKAMKYLDLLFAPGVDKELGADNKGYKYAERGYIYYKTGKFTEAMEDLNKSIKLNSQNFEAFLHRGLLKIKLSDTEAACKDFNKAKKRAESDEEIQEIENLLSSHCKN